MSSNYACFTDQLILKEFACYHGPCLCKQFS